MSFSSIPNSHYDLLYSTDIFNINNSHTERKRIKKLILTLAACAIVVSILLAIGFKLFIISKHKKQEVNNSTLIRNLTSNGSSSMGTFSSQFLSSKTAASNSSPVTRIAILSGHNTEINSSICERPFYPTYNKFGTTVAGILTTPNDTKNKLSLPVSVYLDSKKNVYICDAMNYRIMKYSSDNAQEGTTIIAMPYVVYPRSLYIDQRNDDLYLLDHGTDYNYRVHYLPQNFTKPQPPLLLVGNHAQSYGMDLDRELNIYLSEYGNHRVVKWLSPDYDQYLVIAGNGIDGSGLHQLYYPKGIYVDPTNNDLYIADAVNNRVQRWLSGSTTGETMVQAVVHPINIQRDCHGNLYVVTEKTIKLFSQSIEISGLEGMVIVGVSYNGPTSNYPNTPDHLLVPEGIYLDANNGDLYVADSGFNRIQKFTVNGEIVPNLTIKVQNK